MKKNRYSRGPRREIQEFRHKPPETVDEARDLWYRICNLMDWLRDRQMAGRYGGGWPDEYKKNLHKFLGYWSHTPRELRQTAKVLERLR